MGSLKRDKIIKDINDALIQSARIVVLNITPSSLEYALALYSSSNNVNLSIEDAISNHLQLIDMKISDIIPVVVIASCVDDHRKYRVSAVCLKCPVKMNNGPPSVDVHKIPPRPCRSILRLMDRYPDMSGKELFFLIECRIEGEKFVTSWSRWSVPMLQETYDNRDNLERLQFLVWDAGGKPQWED